MATTLTSRNHRIQLFIDGLPIDGAWKTFTGGGKKSESTFNRPGGMADRESLGGTSERENVTIGREWMWDRDGPLTGPSGFLDLAVDRNADAKVVVQPLDKNKVPVGRARTYAGTIVGCSDPELDSESGDVQNYTVECSAV